MSDQSRQDETIDHSGSERNQETPTGDGVQDRWDAGLAAAFGDPSQERNPQGDVVEALQKPGEATVDDPRANDRPGGADSSDPIEELPKRYELSGEIARGGMGAVLKGRDTSLGREIAVKVMLETHHGRTELLQRFIEEAKIGGQLQHPGIVPIYDMGKSAAHRPYFTMKLIEGRTLAELIQERSEPSDDLPKFLSIFEQICQTVAYAHSRGVIHRDLKPANIMVGEFGEVQVMDWGLAKVLAKKSTMGGGDVESTLRSAAADNPPVVADGHTESGQVLGTPAFMPPEQAKGQIDQLDECCDVFSLGAILCNLLTGGPPYIGKNTTEVHQKAMTGDLADAWRRLSQCGADDALIELAKQCMSADKAARPNNAQEVANAVTSHLESVQARLRNAEIETAQAKTKTEEERKRRKVQFALAASVLMLVIGASAAGLWYQWDRAARDAHLAELKVEEIQRTEAKRLRFALASKQIDESLDLADTQIQTLTTTLAKKGVVFELVNRPTEWLRDIEVAKAPLQRAKDIAKSLEQTIKAKQKSRLNSLEKQLARLVADRKLVLDLERARLERSTNIGGAWKIYDSLKQYEKVFHDAGMDFENMNPKDLSKVICQTLVKEHIAATLDDWAVTASLIGQKSSKLEQIRRTAKLVDPDPLRDRLRNLKIIEDKKALHELVGQLLKQKKLATLSPQSLASIARLLLRGRSTVFFVNHPSKRKGTDSVSRNNDDIGERWLRRSQALHPNDYWLNLFLAQQLNRDNPIEAAGFYRVTLAIRPDNPTVLTNLCVVLQRLKQWDEARAVVDKAIDLDAELNTAWVALGNDYQQYRKDPDQATKAFDRAIGIDETFGPAWLNLANVHYLEKRVEKSAESYRKAIKHWPAHLPADDVWNILGILHAEHREFKEAEAAYRKSLSINPDNLNTLRNLGQTLRLQMRPDEAYVYYKRVLKVNPKQAQSLLGLGIVQTMRGHYKESLDLLMQSLPLLPPNDPDRLRAQQGIKTCKILLKSLERLPIVLKGGKATIAERRQLAEFCRLFFKRYHAGAKLYESAFKDNPSLKKNSRSLDCFRAACCAVQASAGNGRDASKLTSKTRDQLRQKALRWLQEDLDAWEHTIKKQPYSIIMFVESLKEWQSGNQLSPLRSKEVLATLPKAEKDAWKKLWADVSTRQRNAQAAFTETRIKGRLDGKVARQNHRIKMIANRIHIIDMTSKKIDSYLELRNTKGSLLKFNDDDFTRAGLTYDSRIIFTPKENAEYLLVATSFQQRGRGPYEIIVRQFKQTTAKKNSGNDKNGKTKGTRIN